MSEAARDAEASIRALEVHVQALRAVLELARTPAERASVEAVPDGQLRRVARAADALGESVERVLERVEPGLGRDARVLAGMMRAHVPAAGAARSRSTQAATGRDAATI